MVKNILMRARLAFAAVPLVCAAIFGLSTGVASAATPTPVLTSPASSSTQGLIPVAFNLPVAPLAGSLKLIFAGGTTNTLTLATTPGAGAYSFNINPTNVTLNNGTHITSQTSTTIPDGSYSVTLSYQDAGADPAATATSTAVVINTTAPTVSALSPTNAQTNVAVTSPLVLTFNKIVQIGTGNVVIHKASDNSAVATIPVGSTQVTGDGTSTITIHPTVSLAAGTAYYITVDATAFQNSVGTAYAGISAASTWAFTTAASVVVATSPTTPNTGFGTPAGVSYATIAAIVTLPLAGLALVYGYRRYSKTL